MIVLVVIWVAKEGRETEVANLFLQLGAASRKEPGCVQYIVHRHKDDLRTIFLYEKYRDEAALEAHRNSPHFQELGAKLRHVADRREGQLYTVLSGAAEE